MIKKNKKPYRVIIIIPARLESSRLKNKLLKLINGVPMIIRVAKNAIKLKVGRVVVGTDSNEILKICQKNNIEALMTKKTHESGTDRVYEVYNKINDDHDIVINLQGDLPIFDNELFKKIINLFNDRSVDIGSAICDLNSDEIDDQNVVKAKVELDKNFAGNAIDFQRTITNDQNFFHHIGIYAYRPSVLKKFVKLNQTKNEKVRRLEQMRALDNNFIIKLVRVSYNPPSVDTINDLKKIRLYFKNKSLIKKSMKKKIVSFQGLNGAYSELVCRKFYSEYKTLPCNTFEETLGSVSNGKADLAIIPVENNIAGRVADMHLLLENIKLKIIAEHYHKVEHHLMSKENNSLKNITKVYSHTHALSQCKKNISKLKLHAMNFMDTAGAAKYVKKSKEKDISAIASKLASEIYGLKILKKNFEDKKENITRFLVFSKTSNKLDKRGKIITTIVFNTKNLPASLYNALGGFAKNEINLTRLESFFVNKDFKQFSFMIDVESHPDSKKFTSALKVLKKFSNRVKVLGYYKASLFRK